jgi:CheY-like chemotaxis protein
MHPTLKHAKLHLLQILLDISMTPNPDRVDKILVVDDDTRIRDLLRRYLTQEGFEVLQAEDGKALTRVLMREPVDLIVLDLMMPGEDGLSICRRLRTANDRTPIIMLTAKGVPTTTFANPLTPVSCWPEFTRCCAVARSQRHQVHPLPTKRR